MTADFLAASQLKGRGALSLSLWSRKVKSRLIAIGWNGNASLRVARQSILILISGNFIQFLKTRDPGAGHSAFHQTRPASISPYVYLIPLLRPFSLVTSRGSPGTQVASVRGFVWGKSLICASLPTLVKYLSFISLSLSPT